MKTTRVLSLLVMLALLVVACSPANNAVEAPVAPVEEEPAETTAETVAEEEPAAANTIVDIAVADGRFNTLVQAVTAAGLAETLSGEGAFTVFAPTDDAFAALPEGTLDSLLSDPQGALTSVLLYHVVDGAVMAEQVVGLDAAPTLQGEEISIMVDGDQVILNDSVAVVITDIEASNGVIHVIDSVLLPPSMMAAEMPSIAEIAAGNPEFETLVAALDAAGLVETLSGEGSFTVFAPTDDAFDALPEGTVAGLLADPQGALTDVLLYHVLGNTAFAADVVGLSEAETLLGQSVAISSENGNVFLNENAQVVTTDIEAANGVIHVIDAVLIPPSMTAAEPVPSIAEIAAGNEDFSTLVTALEAAGLVETFAGEGEFTVFAPTNAAFEALPEGTLAALLDDPTGQLTQILQYHVVPGTVLAADVVNLSTATTLLGEDIAIAVVDGGVVLNDSVNVVATDVVASNGVIHVIDAVLLPPAQ